MENPPETPNLPETPPAAPVTHADRLRAILQQAREKRTADNAELRARINAVVAQLPVPTDAEMGYPLPTNQPKRIWWTEQECAALLRSLTELKRRADFIHWETLEDYHRRARVFMLVTAVVPHIFPENRRREITGANVLPISLHDPLGKLFGIQFGKLPEEEAPAPVIDPEPVKRITWTDEEETALLLHTASILRKQNISQLPDTSDWQGSIFLSDAIKLAQTNALPSHRRRPLSHPRMILEGLNLLQRLDQYLRMRFLPSLPPPPRELVEAAPAPVHTNGTNGHAPHTNGVEPVARVQLPEPVAPVVTNPFECSDAILFQAATARFMQRLGEMEAHEKRIKELEEYNELRLEEVDKQSTRLRELEAMVGELKQAHGEILNADRKHKPRVGIIGCRKDEFDQVVKLAGERGLDIAFKHYEQDSRPTRIHAEYAIMMKWISHNWEDQIKLSNIPRGQYQFISGGVSKVVGQLALWLETPVTA